MGTSYQIEETYRVQNIKVDVLKFSLPLSYFNDDYSGQEISVFATLCQKFDPEVTDLLPKVPKVVTFIQGGPGYPCSPPATNIPYTNIFIDRGYQVLYMDQRGTGLSTPINSTSFPQLIPKTSESEVNYVVKQLHYILNFTGASIVEDLERIREILLKTRKWSISGQSFGGFCSFIYLSKYPNSIKESFITGGVPPINHGPDDVYRSTYKRAKERNIHYYSKYPQDVTKVNTILTYLSTNKTSLPDGGNLSVERFQQMGLNFGQHGGTDKIHSLVQYFYNDLKMFGAPSFNTLTSVLNSLHFDTNVIYALFQESIYCDGNNPQVKTSNWSADRLRYLPENTSFVFQEGREEPTFFTTEMVYKSMYNDYVELRPFKGLAFALHLNTQWPKLYDIETLRTLTFEKVPIVGAVYVHDLYVDFDLSRKVLEDTFGGRNFRAFMTSEFFHGGYLKDPQRVMGTLFKLLESEVD
ncbi:prolyl aminopeptidase [Yamadazyma tenuis ATCC 10573]|uniref:Prolyl aminopeptidase n=1 Tax=Candida tenuis (strain ATCC 10573 / BCRC 21748 / CBS 615 / JCM 9827 / NBRC 10315 / NRRL Y-1498 / VKM Y-70) TaxID=590646 RepID=G3AW25_CANTC|nr:prolyl aminopeptidase [Yamadazyma tenuis ATCC 10573]EGV66433.1 prolyl aminopeptidase [Yamadazyma tenuis ATCC 10573]